jgi:nicotinamide mononucleotide (NMN) deamidase PncC
MTTRNVPESSVRSHRFVSRPAAQPPIFGLVRRGKDPLGYSSSGVRSPNISQEIGHLCIGPLSRRPRNGGHLGSGVKS